ncbi:MAG: hypothetical protein Kow00127_13760 [Bacteroidales bacterium]
MQFTSLMFTEAGKIQGTTWGFGGLQGYSHNVANVAVKEPEIHQRLGSEIYRAYMSRLREAEPQVFPGEMLPLPKAPTAKDISQNPALSVYTYLRSECQRCHTGVSGHRAEGDYRGSGCAACHIPYSGKGLYEGNDTTINRFEPGHMLIHSIQSSRDVLLTLHGRSWSGIPTKTCTACHNRGRRIGVSYEGLMETAYASPFMSNGDQQSQIHKKNYLHLESDVHLQKGMLCQDCHTSGDLHSLGDLAGAIQAAVEIECTDCHGTPDKYPWELPVGYGDEIAGIGERTPRGVSDTIPEYLKMGWVAPPADGYLLSARGNPFPAVVRVGDSVLLYSASGDTLTLQPLKKLAHEDKLSREGKVAMVQIGSHINRMECYACHASWAPQCYGCHIRIDYSKRRFMPDWVEIAANPLPDGTTADDGDYWAQNHSPGKGDVSFVISGSITEQRSFLRWEDPPLVVNGDHRVSPAIPGCQTTVTIIDSSGKVVISNKIYRIQNAEGAGQEGQLAIDIAPLFPHTTQKVARKCESCHNNPKSMGYGISEGKLYASPDRDIAMDLTNIDGQPIPLQVDTQFNAIRELPMDWSRFLDESGRQLQTVGHHLSGSRPLNREELNKLDRRGVCISCHESIPAGDPAINLMHHVASLSGMDIDNEKHDGLLRKMLLFTAWGQSLLIVIIVTVGIWIFLRRRMRT